MAFVGSNPSPDISGLEPMVGVSNYFIGSDPDRWRTRVPHYARVRYEQVYDGIDLIFRGSQGRLEYDFIVASGANPAAIRLEFSGAENLTLSDDGNLVVALAEARLVQPAPLIYQEAEGGRVQVQGGYVIADDDTVGFEVGRYDETLPLVIDPLLSFSTYLGGSADESGEGIAVDAAGNVYVAGRTGSLNFPTQSAIDHPLEGSSDAFVAKLAPGGRTLLFATYLGGASGETAYGIALDGKANVYLTGYTSSGDFPTTAALQGTLASPGDAFTVKMDSAGSALVFSTYLGGVSPDWGRSIAVDAEGYIYVFGETQSTDFPLSSPMIDRLKGGQDLFITKYTPTASSLYWSTYLGGSDDEQANDLAVDAAGSPLITGNTHSTDFVTDNAQQAEFGGGTEDAFVARVHAEGWSLEYSTFLGGTDKDTGHGIVVDSLGRAYVTSQTNSTDFPTVNAYQAALAGLTEAGVTMYSSDGTMVSSTYLGGTGYDRGRAIGQDPSGNILVAGFTSSSDFPTINSCQPQFAGVNDLFVVRMSPGLRTLGYSTYLGGAGSEMPNGLAVDEGGAAYITGSTTSTDLPTAGAIQPGYGGGDADAFVAKLATPLDFFIAAALPPGRGVARRWTAAPGR
jgi:hypothetical protein